MPSVEGFRELIATADVPAWQRRAGRVARPLVVELLRRGLRIDAAGAARSRRAIDDLFADVAARLADGRRYLCGERFTAADLTFAALAAPVLAPPAYARYLPSERHLPPAFVALVDELRATPAGAFALRIYDDHR